jgi:hypothetical protein
MSIATNPFHREVACRFGLVPNFFMSAPDAPEIIEKLWEFAKSAYLDNPIPSLFKERLFVFLSRFCPVRYCVVRHCGFLAGYGHSSGDYAVRPQTLDQVARLLKTPAPWRRNLKSVYENLEAIDQPIDWPAPDSDLEDWIFAASAVIFLKPLESDRPRALLRNILGGKRLEYLLALLAFIRTAHYWTVVHPGLEIEDDLREFLSANKEIAALLLQDPEPVQTTIEPIAAHGPAYSKSGQVSLGVEVRHRPAGKVADPQTSKSRVTTNFIHDEQIKCARNGGENKK